VAIAIKAGAHPKQIQAMCGHSSIVITLDRYGHQFDSLAEQLADLVDIVGRTALDEAGAISVPDDSDGAVGLGVGDNELRLEQRRRRDSNARGTMKPLTA
jgi:hypothetical protein